MLDVNSLLGFQQKTPQRTVIRLRGTAVPSVNVSTRTYTTVLENVGNDVIYVRDPVYGDSFTAVSDGLFIIHVSDTKSTTNSIFGITLNADPSLDIGSLPNPEKTLLASCFVEASNATRSITIPVYLRQRM